MTSFIKRQLPNVVGAILVLFVGASFVQANSKIYERALNATGWIIVPTQNKTAMGTCWVADKEKRLVVTSRHVVQNSREVLVYFPGRQEGVLVVNSLANL